MPPESIAIIGVGCRYPGADNPTAFWHLLRHGLDAVQEVPPSRWDVDQFYHADRSQPNKTNTRWGGFLEQVDQFDPQFFGIAPREVNSMDPQQRLLLEVAWEALEDGGQVPEQLRGSNTGVFVGIGTHDYSIMLWQEPVNDPYATTGTGNCIAANRISYLFDFKGPSLAVDTACSSSLVAVHLACQSLWCGESTLALAGGVNVLLLPTVTIGFSKGGFMSSAGRCKSFDASADGYVRSEGAGVVVLKPLSQAIQDGDSIYAVIRGTAVNQDGFSNGMAAPNPQAQAAVLRQAYRQAGVAPGQVQYVEAHGTGTKLGDPIELTALGAVLAEGRAPGEDCAIGSVKTNMGHAETAAGVAGLIKVALALKHQQIPPSLHFQTPNPQLDFAALSLRVQTELTPWPSRSAPALAGVNSFGFGGTNAHVVLEAAPEPVAKQSKGKKQKAKKHQRGDLERPWHLFTLSAKSEAALQAQVQQYVQFLEQQRVSIADLCFTLNTRRSRFSHRLAVVTESVEQLQQQLQQRLQAVAAGQSISGGQRHGAPASSPPVVFLFTGQGSQYGEMGRQLYETEPVFRQAIDRCDAILRPELERSLLEVLYPSSHQKSAQKKQKNKARPDKAPSLGAWLDQTAYTQPALFAVEYALVQLWQSWGVAPAVVMGHSIGEYVAACVAGVFSLEDGLRLVAARGRFMQALPPTGAMLSVLADEASVRSLTAGMPDLAIAAVNGPQSTVLSGPRAVIVTIEAQLQAQGIKTARLAVSHAFHSPLMEPMIAKFAKVASKVTYRPPQLPIVSNVTGTFIGEEIATADYWCQHIRQPVQFSRGMDTLHQQGYSVFLEIGAKPVLLGMARACLPAPELVWLASLRSGQSDWQTLLPSLAVLYELGVTIDWHSLESAEGRRVISLPTYPFQRQRYWWEQVTPPGLRPSAVPKTEPHLSSMNVAHPLLGEPLRLAGSADRRFQSAVAAHAPVYLADHCLLDQPVFPAAAYIEIVLAAGQQMWPASRLAIEQLTIEQVLLLAADQQTLLQTVLTPQDDQCYSFEIFSLTADSDPEHSFTRHATGVLAIDRSTLTVDKSLAAVQAEFAQSIPPIVYYQQLLSQGLNYGPCFQGIAQLWTAAGQALSRIQLPAPVTDGDRYQIHPALLDACLQTIGAALTSSENTTYLPVGLDRVQFYDHSGEKLWSYVQIDSSENGTDGSQNGSHHDVHHDSHPVKTVIKANLQLFSETGAIVAQLDGLTLRPLSTAALARFVQPVQPPNLDQWLYEVDWQLQPLPAPAECGGQASSQTWLIFADRQGVSAELVRQLQVKGDRCIVVFASADQVCDPQASDYVIDPAEPIAFRQLLIELADQEILPTGVIHLWSLDSPDISRAQPNSLAVQSAQALTCGSILHLVQAVAQTQTALPQHLWLVTQGAQHVTTTLSTPARLQVQQSAVWGLGRVIQLEHPEMGCICIDLDSHYSNAAIAEAMSLFVQELSQTDSSTAIATNQNVNQIAYRQFNRYVAQLVPQTARSPHPEQLQRPDTAFRLAMSSYGILDHLTLVPADRPALAAGQVDIQVCAAGVNFRDVLNALGLLQPYLEEMGFASADAVPFGGECAGWVVAVGPGVTTVAVGDAVIAAQAIGSLAQFVTVDARFVVPKPPALSFAEAATIPTAFLTAYYGLCHLAKLKPGDRVLIHAAAGGVGQAAIQLAQYLGAEVYATASSSKWEFLRSIGVAHVMNSRSLDFADEVMRLTQGQGVDLVLNSLNGDFIAPSLAVLAPGGRFVEIGKLGIWSAEQVQQARSDVAYFPFDLLAVSQQTPELVAALLQALLPLFQQQILQPLPHTGFPIESAKAAFRYMAQAKHIGKVVVTLPPVLPPACIRTDSSYLITGGLGALGLQVAQWLVMQGAKQLILTGRRSPSPTAMQTIRQLEQAGAEIRVVEADVSDPEAVASLLTTAPWPLRGIIHAAGVLDDGVLQQLSWQRFDRVLAPKVAGAWNLHQASQNLPLDFFVCFSSIASLLGSPGQGSYAAANAFMDALMHDRRRLGLPGLSINWGPWADGMTTQLSDRQQTRLRDQGLAPIAPEQGLHVLETVLRQNQPQVGVLDVNWARFLQGTVPSAFLAIVAPAPAENPPPTARSEFCQQLDHAAPTDRLSLLQTHLRSQLASVLGFSAPELIDPQENFAELGMDSLMAVEFNNRLQKSLNCTIPQTLTFDYPTVEALTNYLIQELLPLDSEIKLSETDFQPEEEAIAAANKTSPIGVADQIADVIVDTNSSDPGPAERSDRNGQVDRQRAVSLSVAVPACSAPPQLSAIPEAHYQFEHSPEYLNLQHDLDRLQTLGNPFFVMHEGTARDTTVIDSRELINYSGYNYLGMSGDPAVIQQVKAAIDRYGTSVSASRVVSGERPIHRELEQGIASFLGTEDCIVYIGGHSTNVTTIGHLFGQRDLILCDALSHNSIRQGCALSGATVMEFTHNDERSLEQLLSCHRHHYEKTLIAIEGIYSTDGDIAPLPEIVALKRQYKTFLLVDEAHSIGVLGKSGRGIAEHFDVEPRQVDLWMGTLSKSFASCGGYIAGSSAIVNYLKYTAPGFVFSVGMSPSNAAAALASLQLLKAEPDRVARLHDRATLFLTLAQQHQFNTGASQQSPIIPVIVGEPHKAVQLSHWLHNRGIHVQPMVYPSVPYYAARLRFFVSCTHSESQIRSTIDILATALKQLK